MYSSAELHTSYQIANAQVRGFPYPHCFVRDVFSPDFYEEIQRNLPDPAVMIPILEARQVQGYNERFVLELHKGEHLAALPDAKRKFWQDVAAWTRRWLLLFDVFMEQVQTQRPQQGGWRATVQLAPAPAAAPASAQNAPQPQPQGSKFTF